jgi:hypothetical protein
VCPPKNKKNTTASGKQSNETNAGFKRFRKRKKTTKPKQKKDENGLVVTNERTVRSPEEYVSSDEEVTFGNIDISSTNRSPRKTTIDQRNDTFTSRDKLPLTQWTIPDSDSDVLPLEDFQVSRKDGPTTAVSHSDRSKSDVPLKLLTSKSPAMDHQHQKRAESSQKSVPPSTNAPEPRKGEKQLKFCLKSTKQLKFSSNVVGFDPTR